MSQEENKFGIKKPEAKPPVQSLKAVVNVILIGNEPKYLNLPFKNIYIPIDPEHIGLPKDMQKAEEEYSKYRGDLKEYQETIKRLNAEYNEAFKKEFEKKQREATDKAAQEATKKVKKTFKDRLGL